MIKGITFDFGGTLAQGSLDKERFKDRLFECVRRLGFGGEKSEFEKTRKGIIKRLMNVRHLNREMSIEDLYRGMLMKLGLHPEREVINRIHRLYIRSFKVELFPCVGEVLEHLNEKYGLAIISNAMSDVPREALKIFGIEKYFKTIVVSKELGIRKPDPEIFKFSLINLGLESREAIHVGDSLEDDVRGAKNAGMKAVWVRRKGEDVCDLADYTINSIKELISFL